MSRLKAVTARTFKTIAVLEVYGGLVLEDGGFGDVQDVMDHFWPGIMTLGCAAMGEPWPAGRHEDRVHC